MAEVEANETSPPLPVFRVKKRQKLYRKRPEDRDDDPEADPTPQKSISPPAQSLDDLIDSASKFSDLPPPAISVAAVLRQRQALQRKRLGIEYSASRPGDSHHQEVGSADDSLAVAAAEQDEDEDMVALRFAPQTGEVVDVADKHM